MRIEHEDKEKMRELKKLDVKILKFNNYLCVYIYIYIVK